MTPPKMCLRFDIVLVNCRNVYMIYCARVGTRLIFSLLSHCSVSILLRRLKHRRFFTESALRSLHHFSRRHNYCARAWTCQISLLLCHRCVSITIHCLKHRRFFTEPALQSPTSLLVAGTIVQKCRLTSSDRYYAIPAFPSHYAVSNIDGYSQSRHYDPLTGAAIFYGVSQTSCYQNPLVGFFNIDFDFFAFLRTQTLSFSMGIFSL